MATDALSLARRAREAWEDKEDKEKVTVGVVKKHFDALEARITELEAVVPNPGAAFALQAQIETQKEETAELSARLMRTTNLLLARGTEILRLEEANRRLETEIKNIHRQHASERPSW
jgi:hypothetical protein